MRFCTKCGNELMDEAVICPKCGCAVEAKNYILQEAKKQETQEKTKEFDLSWTPLMYGILTILNVLFCSLSWFLPSRPISVVSSYTERAFNCCGMLAIITGVKYLRVRKGFALSGLILGSFSLLVLFVLFCIAAGRYYY